ncbi:hypothetical protein CSUI_002752 [Cystoisospora suis]|uniref:Secreted protein n=1 Tax=Cystoisospora suis TaxID=483139 RepID=A0A2C6L834_9APIC|nr:hypothetical protein CSUI_002752 [Cystoisospora suis]
MPACPSRSRFLLLSGSIAIAFCGVHLPAEYPQVSLCYCSLPRRCMSEVHAYLPFLSGEGQENGENETTGSCGSPRCCGEIAGVQSHRYVFLTVC